ncbi:hypothetical protein [Phycicoccus endophyticus]|uniref:hypothetical protein n=1 Tax=Phycicoccus endophyticus TaxID=1690220 RepID=UPI0021D009DF|nr:hypothetical protein [Phycicoccus endophyticus]
MSSAATAPVVADPRRLRTVLLVGPSGAGASRLFDRVVDTLAPGRSTRAEGTRRWACGRRRSSSGRWC